MTSGQPIGKNYPTLMPDLTDIADVQQAFSLYHFGKPDFDPNVENPATDSIEGHLGAVNSRVTLLEGRPVAGGQVTDSEPVQVGTPPQAVPEGYIWVDPSDTSPTIPDFPTVIYSPTEPSGLTVADTGTIWVDEDGSAMVLNTNNYLSKTEAAAQYYTQSQTNALLQQANDSAAATAFLLMGA